MDDGFDESIKLNTMGATGNPNSSSLAALQERKKNIEDSLAKCTVELKQLCLQEADLTGIIPSEMPLEPGESPPILRRRVGTAFQLPDNLFKNTNNNETISDLELRIQTHANVAEAALELAHKHNISKTLRRQRMSEYQEHKLKLIDLQGKLTVVKDKAQQHELQKQKKKPRPTEQEDNISMLTTSAESFTKSDLRHSMRSHKGLAEEVQQRYPQTYTRVAYKNSNSVFLDPHGQPEEQLAGAVYRLSLNGYKDYLERQENITNIHVSSSYNTLHYPQASQMSPQFQQSHPNIFFPQHARSSHAGYHNYPPSYPQAQPMAKNHYSPTYHPRLQHRQSSPSTNTPKMFYPPPPPPAEQHHNNYRMYADSEQMLHPHQIQPHQQYEHMPGLGGYWKKLESGETVWCNSSPVETSWQRDKRFGSLDRRKNKRLNKRSSPSVDPKSATLSSVPTYTDHVRTASIKSPHVINRRSQDNRQLVRTQSLGSVGAQTIDSVWPSDDNSSCESDTRSINEANQGIRRNKQKEWVETSLDGPVSPTHSVISRSQSALPSVLSPEEKYMATPPPVHFAPPPPLTLKPALEIPAESNPSPRLPDTNIEIYNNNVPRNGTVVQAGHCKPYHEETKPFEMSDFYKYSTKYKKSPVKQKVEAGKPTGSLQRNLNDHFESSSQHYSPAQASPVRLDNSNSLNSSLDISQISNANVAERFSDEMNAWYTSQTLKIDNSGGGGAAKGKSTATLV